MDKNIATALAACELAKFGTRSHNLKSKATE